MADILVLHGPNLNLLGKRQTDIYGSDTLESIDKRLAQMAGDFSLESQQYNAEHQLVEAIQTTRASFIIINAAAFTHSSIALRDALLAVEIPFIEVHLSNISARETFREHSYLADIAVGVIYGFGPLSYELALKAAIEHLRR